MHTIPKHFTNDELEKALTDLSTSIILADGEDASHLFIDLRKFLRGEEMQRQIGAKAMALQHKSGQSKGNAENLGGHDWGMNPDVETTILLVRLLECVKYLTKPKLGSYLADQLANSLFEFFRYRHEKLAKDAMSKLEAKKGVGIYISLEHGLLVTIVLFGVISGCIARSLRKLLIYEPLTSSANAIPRADLVSDLPTRAHSPESILVKDDGLKASGFSNDTSAFKLSEQETTTKSVTVRENITVGAIRLLALLRVVPFGCVERNQFLSDMTRLLLPVQIHHQSNEDHTQYFLQDLNVLADRFTSPLDHRLVDCAAFRRLLEAVLHFVEQPQADSKYPGRQSRSKNSPEIELDMQAAVLYHSHRTTRESLWKSLAPKEGEEYKEVADLGDGRSDILPSRGLAHGDSATFINMKELVLPEEMEDFSDVDVEKIQSLSDMLQVNFLFILVFEC